MKSRKSPASMSLQKPCHRKTCQKDRIHLCPIPKGQQNVLFHATDKTITRKDCMAEAAKKEK